MSPELRKIVEANVSALAVKQNDMVVGVVTETDVLKSLVEKKDPEATGIAEIMDNVKYFSHI
jgi:CBS domain-containing protein